VGGLLKKIPHTPRKLALRRALTSARRFFIYHYRVKLAVSKVANFAP